MEAWLRTSYRFSELQNAQARARQAPAPSDALNQRVVAMRSRFDKSQTKKTYDDGLRACFNSPHPFQAPVSTKATVARRKEEVVLTQKSSEVRAAKKDAGEADAA